MNPRWLVLLCLACRAPEVPMGLPDLIAQTPRVGPVLPGLYMNRFTPPAEYERWYHAMEACSGGIGNYASVEWLLVSAPWLEGQRKTHGSWSGKTDGSGIARIVVNAVEAHDSTLVAHEALHDILWRSGWHRPPLSAKATDTDSIEAMHPTPPFDRCAPTYYADPR